MSASLTPVMATSSKTAEELRALLSAHGWQVCQAGPATSKREALDALVAAFDFPDYFGRNLDALWDGLTDLTEPTALVWTGWEPCAVHAAQDWVDVVAVLKDRVNLADDPAFSVVFVAANDQRR